MEDKMAELRNEHETKAEIGPWENQDCFRAKTVKEVCEALKSEHLEYPIYAVEYYDFTPKQPLIVPIYTGRKYDYDGVYINGNSRAVILYTNSNIPAPIYKKTFSPLTTPKMLKDALSKFEQSALCVKCRVEISPEGTFDVGSYSSNDFNVITNIENEPSYYDGKATSFLVEENEIKEYVKIAEDDKTIFDYFGIECICWRATYSSLEDFPRIYVNVEPETEKDIEKMFLEGYEREKKLRRNARHLKL